MAESISINGVCLTVAGIRKGSKATELRFDLSPETLQKTNLKGLKNGDQVNFERSLTLNDLLGGHIVQGHVDGVGVVQKILPQGPNRMMWFKGPRDIMKYVVPKGSVAVNGVSLTAVSVGRDQF